MVKTINATIVDSRELKTLAKLTRKDIVPYYRHMILNNAPDSEIQRVNRLILSKWLPSGLNFIKERAWKGINIH